LGVGAIRFSKPTEFWRIAAPKDPTSAAEPFTSMFADGPDFPELMAASSCLTLTPGAAIHIVLNQLGMVGNAGGLLRHCTQLLLTFRGVSPVSMVCRPRF
jgi:hypothetical protein